MTDSHAANGPETAVPPPGAVHPPFPAARLLYSVLFGIIAWFVLWITFLLVIAQFVVVAVNGRVNDELKHFTGQLVAYLGDLLGFMAFTRDDQPFPFGPFPK